MGYPGRYGGDGAGPGGTAGLRRAAAGVSGRGFAGFRAGSGIVEGNDPRQVEDRRWSWRFR